MILNLRTLVNDMSPPIITPSLLSAIRNQPHLLKNTWYIVSGVTLSALNRPDEIPSIFRHAIAKGGDSVDSQPDQVEQLAIARQMREALVKSAAICGLPRTINSLLELKKVTPLDLLDEPFGYSPTGRSKDIYNVASSAILLRGQRFFDLIYGKISSRVMNQMDRSGTEDLGLTARLMYGHLLSNNEVLSHAQTSFVVMAGLYVPIEQSPPVSFPAEKS